MGRSSSKRKTQPSLTSSVEDSDYVLDEKQELEEVEDEEVGDHLEGEEEENEEENKEDEDELDYDPHRFISTDAKDLFDSYWSKRAVLYERGINLNYFSEEPADFKSIMATRGWSTATTFRDAVDPNLI